MEPLLNSPRQCPRCGVVYQPPTRVCTDCSIDLFSGDRVERSERAGYSARKQEQETEISVGRYAWALLKACLPGLFKPGVLIVSVLTAALGLAFVAAALIFVILLQAVFMATAAGAVGMIVYAQAAAWIVGGDFSLLPDLLTDFVSAQWTIFGLLFVLPIPLFIILMILAS